jgi:hypothetical protein
LTDASNSLIYGNWENISSSEAFTHHVNMDAKDLAAYWHRCSLSADFLAQYFALFVPDPAPTGRLRRKDVSSVLAYLLNELFENCAKFSSGPDRTVNLDARIMSDYILIRITNHMSPENQAPFIEIITELLNNDPHELYFQRLEENVEQGLEGSGLGYLTLMKDFGVEFGFRLRSISYQDTAVDVQAKVSLLQD